MEIAKCDKCGKEEITIKFYYGLYDLEYHEEKWCNLCENCQNKFRHAGRGTEPGSLFVFYNELLDNLEKNGKADPKTRKKAYPKW